MSDRRFWPRLKAAVAQRPVLAPVLAGALARGVAALVGGGLHARDDYYHVLEPAYRWLRDSTFVWEHSGLPGAGIRSELVPRLVQAGLELLWAAGVRDPDWSFALLSLAAGAYSLLVVPAVYFSARRLFAPADIWGPRLAAWLAALHFAMPYAGTRLLLGAMAMPPLALAVGLAASPRARSLALAGFACGLAAWLRFQVGAAILGLGVAIGLRAWREGRGRALGRELSPFLAGGLGALLLQGVFDLATTGQFLGPLWHNVLVNLCAATQDPEAAVCLNLTHMGLVPNPDLSTESPLAYLGMWLLLTAPPATLVLVPAMWRGARRLGLVAWPFALFVILHSLIPHKEERFMLPVLPLFLLLGAAAPAVVMSATGRAWARVRAWWPWARGWLLALHAVVLVGVVISPTQAAQRGALGRLRGDLAARALVSLGPEVPAFFLARDDLPVRRHGRASALWLADTLRDLAQQGIFPNRFLGFAPDGDEIAGDLTAAGLRCEPPELFVGSLGDRLLHFLNPRHNRRRAPVLLWRCEPSLVASLGGGPR